jgi:hypothetical protein
MGTALTCLGRYWTGGRGIFDGAVLIAKRPRSANWVGTVRPANHYIAMRKKLGEFVRRAHECENLESRVEDEAVRKTYGELAAHWRKLAAQEERLHSEARKKSERRTWSAPRAPQPSRSLAPRR